MASLDHGFNPTASGAIAPDVIARFVRLESALIYDLVGRHVYISVP